MSGDRIGDELALHEGRVIGLCRGIAESDLRVEGDPQSRGRDVDPVGVDLVGHYALHGRLDHRGIEGGKFLFGDRDGLGGLDLHKVVDDRSILCSMVAMNTSTSQDTIDVRQRILETGQRIMAGKGFSAVGLNEILATVGVPKGSFYHYFGSKDAFGEAMLTAYFEDYLTELDKTLRQPGLTMAQRLMTYLQQWQETQSFFGCQGKCLAVKLGAEVADLSEAMRSALKHGTSGITQRLTRAIESGVAEGSLSIDGEPDCVAQSLYQLWLGASVLVKIVRDTRPFEAAMTTTRQILHLPH